MTKLKVIQLISISIISILIVSSCDIIDSVLGGGTTTAHDTKNIERIEVDFLIDNARSVIDYLNPPPNTPSQDIATGVEFGTEISSIAGESVWIEADKNHYTEFNDVPILGQTISGELSVYFFENPRKIKIICYKGVNFSSTYFGNVNQVYKLKYDGIPYYQSYTDIYTGLEVDEYYISGSPLNNAETWFTEDNALYWDQTLPTVCTNRAFIKVKVHFKS